MKKKYIYYITQFLVMCLVFNISYGQNGSLQNLGTKISDIGTTQPESLKSNSILELESKAKGFLLPRMTTAERNEIDVNSQNSTDTGLAIFNIDNDCVEYYTAISKKWVSLCGTLPPAKVEFDGQCDELQIALPGGMALQAGVPITGKNVQVTVPVRINEPGTYQVDVYSRKEGKSNGYYFSTTGTFLSKGIVEVTIVGQGTPIDGYENDAEGDSFIVNLNGVEALVCSSKQHVKKAATNYSVVPKKYKVNGPLYLGVNVTGSNIVEIDVDVSTIGKYIIESISDEVNGLSLYGEGSFSNVGKQKVILRAAGMPTGGVSSNLDGFEIPIKTNSGIPGSIPAGTQIFAKVEAVKIKPLCADVKVIGKYVKGSSIKAPGNSIVIPVEVLAPGKATLKLTSPDGFVFKSEEINFTFDVNTNNIREVSLQAEEKIIPFETTESTFNFESIDGLDLSSCSGGVKIIYEQPNVDYEIVDCKVKPRNKYYPVAKQLSEAKHAIDVTVKVKIAGPYTITTKDLSASGVTFTASGVFDLTDQGQEKKIILLPVGQFGGDPNISQPYSFSVSKDLSKNPETCEFTIFAGLREINMLYFGNNTITKQGINGLFSLSNFGPEGRFAKVVSLNPHMYTDNVKESAVTRSAKLKKYIIDNEIDIVFIGYGTAQDPSKDPDTYFKLSGNNYPILDMVIELVKAKKITLIYFGETAGQSDNVAFAPIRTRYITNLIYENETAPIWTNFGFRLPNIGEYHFEFPSVGSQVHRYITPSYLLGNDLTENEKTKLKVKGMTLRGGSSHIGIEPGNKYSDKFIVLSDLYSFTNGNGKTGYTLLTTKDYPIFISAAPYVGNFDSKNFPISTNMGIIGVAGKGGYKTTYNSVLFTSVVSEMIEQIKEGL